MTLIDLSHPLFAAMPVWPGTPGPEFLPLAAISTDGFAEQSFRLSSHTGTHIDAPAHIFEGGATLDRYEPAGFFGRIAVVDARETAGSLIEMSHLLRCAEAIGQAEFVLLHTGFSRYWGEEVYGRSYPVLEESAARWLARQRLKGVGIDCPSFDVPGSCTYPVHRLLLETGILLIENLTNVGLVPAEGAELAAFPLAIRDAEACPVRAVALF